MQVLLALAGSLDGQVSGAADVDPTPAKEGGSEADGASGSGEGGGGKGGLSAKGGDKDGGVVHASKVALSGERSAVFKGDQKQRNTGAKLIDLEERQTGQIPLRVYTGCAARTSAITRMSKSMRMLMSPLNSVLAERWSLRGGR